MSEISIFILEFHTNGTNFLQFHLLVVNQGGDNKHIFDFVYNELSYWQCLCNFKALQAC